MRISNQITHIEQNVKLWMTFTHQFDHKASGGGGWNKQPDWPQLSTWCFGGNEWRTDISSTAYIIIAVFVFSCYFHLNKEFMVDKNIRSPKSYDTGIGHCISQTQYATAHYGIHQVKHGGRKGGSSGCGWSWSLHREQQRRLVQNKELNNKKEEIFNVIYLC